MTTRKLVMIPWRQAFASESQTTVDFYRACPTTLTVDPSYTVRAFHPGLSGRTLFREVQRLSWQDRSSPEVQSLINTQAGGKVESEDAFAHRILNALAFVVYNT